MLRERGRIRKVNENERNRRKSKRKRCDIPEMNGVV